MISILIGSKHFSPGICQNYLVFIPAKKYIKYFSGTTRIDLWRLNGISVENVENTAKSESHFGPTFIYIYIYIYINIKHIYLQT